MKANKIVALKGWLCFLYLTRSLASLPVLAPVFSQAVWPHVQVLRTGAGLAPGKRTVTASGQIMGLSTYPDFQTYHRVLNRAVWSPLKASRLLRRVWLPGEVIVLGLDDTIERRRGNQIHAKGIDRDPVRSSRSHFVQVSGGRWLSGMPLSLIAWANHVGALPFLTVRCPSERFYDQRGRRPQSLTECTWPIIRPVRRWLPQRDLAVGADSRFTALELLNPVKRLPRTSLMTRLRLDTALYAPAPPPDPGTTGRLPAHGQAPPHPGGRVGR